MRLQDLTMGSIVMNAEECLAECEVNPMCNIAAYLTVPTDGGQVRMYRVALFLYKSVFLFFCTSACVLLESRFLHFARWGGFSLASYWNLDTGGLVWRLRTWCACRTASSKFWSQAARCPMTGTSCLTCGCW